MCRGTASRLHSADMIKMRLFFTFTPSRLVCYTAVDPLLTDSPPTAAQHSTTNQQNGEKKGEKNFPSSPSLSLSLSLSFSLSLFSLFLSFCLSFSSSSEFIWIFRWCHSLRVIAFRLMAGFEAGSDGLFCRLLFVSF